MIEVREITFGYSAPVLKGVSFEAGGGELLAVLGPNGAGKSTLLKIIVGLLKATGGSVLLEGRDVREMSRRESARLIGYVAQESSLRFPLTATEFVLQGRFARGRIVGFESEEDAREAARVMKLTDAFEFAARPVTELSGGERQRVMLARALVSRPRLLILDEPVANLDISHQVKLFELVRSIAQSENMAVIVVTHELNLAAEFATLALMMKSGEVVACGPPGDVLTEERLRAVFEARLLVDSNPVSGAPRVTLIRERL